MCVGLVVVIMIVGGLEGAKLVAQASITRLQRAMAPRCSDPSCGGPRFGFGDLVSYGVFKCAENELAV